MAVDTGLLLRALAFAAERHSAQRRKDVAASPYINHPIALANVLANEAGIDSAEVLAAAILHDTLEDTETTYEELKEHFGRAIAEVVREVSDDKALSKDDRKRFQIEHAKHLSRRARLVKLADKTCNVRDMAAHAPAGWPLQRRGSHWGNGFWRVRSVDSRLGR